MNNPSFFIRSILLLLILSLTLPGCSRKKLAEKIAPKTPETEISVDIIATDTANPDATGRPSPIIVRLYELKSLGGFQAADYFTLLHEDEAALGADLVAREEYQLRPGTSQNYSSKPSAETQYIAVMAAYRQLNQIQWKTSSAIPAQKHTKYHIQIDAQKVSIEIK